MVAPPTGSLPLPWWAQRTLSVPHGAQVLGGARVLPRVPWHQLPAQGSSGATTRPVVPAHASRFGATQVPLRVPWCQLPPPSSGQLGCHHVSCGASSHLLARGSSGATMCPGVPAPASRLEAAQVPPCVPWHTVDCGLSKYTNILR
jgi:hypothetical protein